MDGRADACLAASHGAGLPSAETMQGDGGPRFFAARYRHPPGLRTTDADPASRLFSRALLSRTRRPECSCCRHSYWHCCFYRFVPLPLVLVVAALLMA